MDDYVSLCEELDGLRTESAKRGISHRFVLGREMRPPIFTLFAAKLQTPKIAITLYYLAVIMNLDKKLFWGMESFQSSCHDYMMPTLNAIIRKDEKISTGACVGFFGILSALIGLLGTAAAARARPVHQKCKQKIWSSQPSLL